VVLHVLLRHNRRISIDEFDESPFIYSFTSVAALIC